jgi:hypothetical protein
MGKWKREGGRHTVATFKQSSSVAGGFNQSDANDEVESIKAKGAADENDDCDDWDTVGIGKGNDDWDGNDD